MKRNGSAMIGTLIAVAIILIMVVVLFRGGCGDALGLPSVGKSTRADGKGATTVGLVKAKAQDDVCKGNLEQLRQMISVEKTTDDQAPASLNAIHAPASILKCPIGGEAYVYDPATGAVHCPHPGHEKY